MVQHLKLLKTGSLLMEVVVPKSRVLFQVNCTLAKLAVTFVYRNYKVAFNIGDQPRRGIGFGFSIGPGGVAGSINLPGVGRASGVFGGINAVQATVGDINNRVAQIRSSF